MAIYGVAMENKFGDPVPTTPDERALLDAVKALFASKSDYGDGADFRAAFVAEAMADYCESCGRAVCPCYCTRDD